MTTTMFTTRYDAPTRHAVRLIIEWALAHGADLDFYDTINLVDGLPPTLEDVAQYAVDAVNEDADEYYILTADMNIVVDDQES